MRFQNRAVNINVAVDRFNLRIDEFHRGRHQFHAPTRKRSNRIDPANDFGCDKYVAFVDKLLIEKCAEQLSAAFQQHIGHFSATQFFEQCAWIGAEGCLGRIICRTVPKTPSPFG